MAFDLPAISRLAAPASWNSVDFISDLHLQPSEPATFHAWRRFMQTTSADAVFILGDLFEVWIGDDAIADPAFSFESECTKILRDTAARRPVFFMHGNRDFLIGDGLMSATNLTLLNDPTALSFARDTVVLSHGDVLCLDDVDYLKFRQVVRSEKWIADFLAKPLEDRAAFAADLRRQSESRKSEITEYADVDSDAARAILAASDASIFLHGHTHKPATHLLGDSLGDPMKRIVLSDWDANANPPRLEVMRASLDANRSLSFERIPLDRN